MAGLVDLRAGLKRLYHVNSDEQIMLAFFQIKVVPRVVV